MKKPLRFILTPIMLGVLSTSAFALPKAPGIAYPPHRIKPNTPHLAPSGLTPLQVAHAYGFNRIPSSGKGQIIAIVDAYDDPRIESDLAVFNKHFGLPSCTTKNDCFKKIYAKGKKPKTDPDWAGEIALDVEWAHAIAPDAKIILVEAATAKMGDLMLAVQVAVKHGATIVSMSWGVAEYGTEIQTDKLFNNPNVTFLASSGDDGTGTIYPSTSPYVTAVGGTTLSVDSYGNYQGEEAWSGSGGGLSSYESWPDYQKSFPIPQSNNKRGVPDVAYNADPNTGFSVYNTVPNADGTGWLVIGGTSAGAPQWAGLVAIANSMLDAPIGRRLNAFLYQIANPAAGNALQYFNDISTGNNGTCGYYCTAQKGYDYVTGLGSPNVDNLIDELIALSKHSQQFRSLTVAARIP